MKSKRRAGFDPNQPVKTAVKAVLAPWAHPTGNIIALHLRARGKTPFLGGFWGYPCLLLAFLGCFAGEGDPLGVWRRQCPRGLCCAASGSGHFFPLRLSN